MKCHFYQLYDPQLKNIKIPMFLLNENISSVNFHLIYLGKYKNVFERKLP